jgi:hypothetical protein
LFAIDFEFQPAKIIKSEGKRKRGDEETGRRGERETGGAGDG